MKTNDIRTIMVAKIIANRENPRSEIGDITELKASIKAHGLINPITVRPIEKGFEVVAGSRRLTALKELGIEKVDCNVIDESDEAKIFEIASAENIVRKDMSASDECKAVRKMLSDGKDPHTIAAEFGHNVRWVFGRAKMADLGDEILAMLDAGDITLGHAEVLTMCKNEDEMRNFSTNCKYYSPEEIKKRILAQKKNLADAPFDSKKECKNCKKQTICQKDIFGDVSENYCQDGECYQQHMEKYLERKRKECEDNGLVDYAKDHEYTSGFEGNWDKNYIDASPDADLNDSQKDDIEKLKAAGKKPYYLITKDKCIIKWDRGELPEEEISEEEKAEKAERQQEQEINKFLNEKVLDAVREKTMQIVNKFDDETVAFLLNAISGDEFEITNINEETGDEEKVYDPYLAHIGESEEKTEGDEVTKVSQKETLVDWIVSERNIASYWFNDVDERVKKYLGLKSREEYEKEFNETNKEN